MDRHAVTTKHSECGSFFVRRFTVYKWHEADTAEQKVLEMSRWRLSSKEKGIHKEAAHCLNGYKLIATQLAPSLARKPAQ